MKKITAVLLLALLTSACATTNIYQANNNKSDSKYVLVFLDGTANDQGSRTNVSRLFELSVNQNREDITAFYTEGVGTDGRIIGAITGWGIGHDVREAYQFTAEHYTSSKSELHIFGFSRGAYAARILSGLLYVAGIPDLSSLEDKKKKQFIKALYAAYKGKDKPLQDRINDTNKVYAKYNINKNNNINIETLGIWDTVEALGKPNRQEEINRPNTRYVDQICNINHVYHALALDDNRGRIYTPILITGEHVVEPCKETVVLDKVVEEVWFSGAHADLGGGYKDSDHLSGVSMNWMLSKIKNYGFLPNNAGVYANPLGTIHDAEGANALYKRAFKRLPRNIGQYLEDTRYNKGKIKIHQSALGRIARGIKREYDSEWYKQTAFEGCFVEEGPGYVKKGDCVEEVE